MKTNVNMEMDLNYGLKIIEKARENKIKKSKSLKNFVQNTFKKIFL